MNHYTFRAIWSPEDDHYVGLVAEFPSLSWLAPTAGEAAAGIEKLVADWAADKVARGEEQDLPVPLADRPYSGEISCRMSPNLHRKLAIEAAEQGVSLNLWINEKLCSS